VVVLDDVPRSAGATYGRHRMDANGEFTDRPVTGVGLLFLAFAASVTDQFQFVLSPGPSTPPSPAPPAPTASTCSPRASQPCTA